MINTEKLFGLWRDLALMKSDVFRGRREHIGREVLINESAEMGSLWPALVK
jgi:hypothetical protein